MCWELPTGNIRVCVYFDMCHSFAFTAVLVIFFGQSKNVGHTLNVYAMRLRFCWPYRYRYRYTANQLLFVYLLCKLWRSSLTSDFFARGAACSGSVSCILFLSFLEFYFFLLDIRHVCAFLFVYVFVFVFVLVIMLFKCVRYACALCALAFSTHSR